MSPILSTEELICGSCGFRIHNGGVVFEFEGNYHCTQCKAFLVKPILTREEYIDAKNKMDEAREIGDSPSVSRFMVLINDYLKHRRAQSLQEARQNHASRKENAMERIKAIMAFKKGRKK